MGKQCKCGKGHVSQWDGKCGHCRTKKEQRDHEYALTYLEVTRHYNNMTTHDAYIYNREACK